MTMLYKPNINYYSSVIGILKNLSIQECTGRIRGMTNTPDINYYIKVTDILRNLAIQPEYTENWAHRIVVLATYREILELNQDYIPYYAQHTPFNAVDVLIDTLGNVKSRYDLLLEYISEKEYNYIDNVFTPYLNLVKTKIPVDGYVYDVSVTNDIVRIRKVADIKLIREGEIKYGQL